MKINVALMLLLLSIICSIASCVPSQVKLDDRVIQTSDSIAATRTQVYLDFLASRPTATPTDIVTPSPSATILPTLSPEDEDVFIFDRIENNGDCEFPCVWGIQPGITTSDEYLNMLSPVHQHIIGDDLLYYPSYGDFKMKDLELHPFPFTSVYPFFTEGNEPVVSLIDYSIFTVRYDEEGNQVIDDEVQNAMRLYALSNILSQFGMPSRVLLRARFADEQTDEAPAFDSDSSVFYEELGFAVFFRGPLLNRTTNNVVRHCFHASNLEKIRVISHSPEDGLSLIEVLGERYQRGPGYFQGFINKGVFFDLEDVSGIDLKDFFYQYKSPSDYCIESQIEKWQSE